MVAVSLVADPDRLDDQDALEWFDPDGMLRRVASSAAQVREALRLAAEVASGPEFSRFVEDGRPRAVVVTGMGGSGIAGDVLAAACGPGCPVPICTVREYRLPGWVGAADCVLAVSCSGDTEEVVTTAADAVRRGCRVLAVAPPESRLAAVAEQAGAPLMPVRATGEPRASLWALSVPLLVTVRALRLLSAPDEVFETAARRLEDVSSRCGPASESLSNPAKGLALELAGTVPLVWGTSPVAGVAAQRFQNQLAENAKYPGIAGQLPEAAHNQVVTFDGVFGQGAPEEDFFRDRVDNPEPEPRLRLVLLRDTEEHPQAIAQADGAASVAATRGLLASSLAADGEHPLERLAELIGLVDYTTVYLALLYGVDPTPVRLIRELKQGVAE